MGRKSQRKNVAMFDSDDDTSSVSSSSTMQSERALNPGMDEVQVHKDSMLDQSLDALYEKRSSTREEALASIIEAFNSDLQHEFVEKKFATLLHQCLHCTKKGSSKETSLASHVIGLLALTVGLGDQAQEILEESITPLSQALKSGRDALKITSILECLAVITFVGGTDPDQTEKSMQIIWQMIHPKLGSNVVATKPSPAVVTAVVSSWAFLLTTVDQWTLSPKIWLEVVTYFSTLLEKDDRSVRIAAGEALAVIFELGDIEKFSAEAKGSTNGSVKEGSASQEAVMHMHGLKSKVTNQVRDLSAEAGGKGSAKKDLNTQRNLFKDLTEFLEGGYAPETSTKVGGDSLQTSTWCQMIQLNFLKHYLGGGFIKHMQENDFLHDVFSFTPKKFGGRDSHLSSEEKRLFKSPNSALNKARTQFLNNQRKLAKNMNVGHYAATAEENE